eukprot:c2230_g1_i1.p1 GENE.c2230_g1_i1~~c2230_g1_i1.p1  ORF type:complete len:1018 (+),score=220.72 c2230_g1_i1:143-3196(+)
MELENNYTDNLSHLESNFISPLVWTSKVSGSILPEAIVEQCFGGLIQLIALHKELTRLVENARPKERLQLFLTHVIEHLHLYQRYYTYFSAWCDGVNQQVCTRGMFREWVNKVQTVTETDLLSLMRLPWNHPLQLHTALSSASVSLSFFDPDNHTIAAALTALTELIVLSRDCSRKENSHVSMGDRLRLFSYKISGLGESLVQPQRKLLLEDRMWLNRRLPCESPLLFVLFNDILVVINEVDPDVAETLTTKHVIEIKNLRIKDVPDSEYTTNTFHLVDKNQSHICVCDTRERKYKWLDILEDVTQRERVRLKGIAFRTESRACDSREFFSAAVTSGSFHGPYSVVSLRECTVRISDSVLVSESSKPFVLYLVTCTTETGFVYQFHKRFSEFVALHTQLKKTCKTLPKLPPSYVDRKLNLSALVRGERMLLLERYLQDLLLNNALQLSEHLHSFLAVAPGFLQGFPQPPSENHDKSCEKLSIVFPDQSVHVTKVGQQIFANELLATLFHTTDVAPPIPRLRPGSYRFFIVRATGFQVVGQRDRVCSLLNSFGSNQLVLCRHSSLIDPPESGSRYAFLASTLNLPNSGIVLSLPHGWCVRAAAQAVQFFINEIEGRMSPPSQSTLSVLQSFQYNSGTSSGGSLTNSREFNGNAAVGSDFRFSFSERMVLAELSLVWLRGVIDKTEAKEGMAVAYRSVVERLWGCHEWGSIVNSIGEWNELQSIFKKRFRELCCHSHPPTCDPEISRIRTVIASLGSPQIPSAITDLIPQPVLPVGFTPEPLSFIHYVSMISIAVNANFQNTIRSVAEQVGGLFLPNRVKPFDELAREFLGSMATSKQTNTAKVPSIDSRIISSVVVFERTEHIADALLELNRVFQNTGGVKCFVQECSPSQHAFFHPTCLSVTCAVVYDTGATLTEILEQEEVRNLLRSYETHIEHSGWSVSIDGCKCVNKTPVDVAKLLLANNAQNVRVLGFVKLLTSRMSDVNEELRLYSHITKAPSWRAVWKRCMGRGSISHTID